MFASISHIHQHLVAKKVSATEIAESFLATIKKKEKSVHAFITPTPELALETAKRLDRKIASGERISPLAGVPCAVKDSLLLQDVPCTAGSKILEQYVAPYDATAVKKLRAQDVLFVGKTNTDEFNMGASTEHSAFGPTKNPYDHSRVAGGSSGGSAASVAAGESVVALGADTGGSIRLPAAFCGVVGLKPTYGAVSRYGLIAMASSLDQVGPLAKTAQDAEAVFQAIGGRDELDATSLEHTYRPFGKLNVRNVKIGVPKEYFGEGLAPEIEKRVRSLLARLEQAGARVQEVHLPHTKYALAAYYVINTSEVSANLARYDGIRYGKSKKSAKDLFAGYAKTRGAYLGDEVKRRVMLGTYALSAGYYDAYYLKAQKVRMLLQQDFDKAFERVDVLMGPVSPTLPFKIGERSADPLSMYLVDVYTVPVNLVGLPSIAVPAGLIDGLPTGVQIIGKPLAENFLFAAAKELEKIAAMV